MKYNFDQTSNRLNTSSVKWDVKESELPMWVADMDFMVMPEIQEAIIEAAKNQSYGYTYATKEYFESYRHWWLSRHNIDLSIDDMIFSTGVVASLDSIIRTLTEVNHGVMLLTPVYHTFFNVIRNNKREIVTSSLIKEDDYYIDYEDIENKFKNNNVDALIFCNPHNPIGRIWSKKEIKKLIELCDRYGVYFISDEIHCDIVDPGYHYNSALEVGNDKTIVCLSPGKAFNLAGLHASATVIKDEKIRKELQDAYYHDDIGEPNYFSVPAVITAYNKGHQYNDELNVYLYNNKEYVSSFIKDKLPKVKLVSGHATYLLWLDISELNISSDLFVNELRKETGLILSPGIQFGNEGKYYLRMNIATSLENVKDAINRLAKYIASKE